MAGSPRTGTHEQPRDTHSAVPLSKRACVCLFVCCVFSQVLDLDETLVHSSFKPIPSPDYILPVEIDGKVIDVYVLKRPWCDHFMESVGHRFEVVVFTASLSKYADPLLDLLDKAGVVRWRLFRESCVHYEGNYVKDLACLGRCLSDTIIVDNSPHSYLFQVSSTHANVSTVHAGTWRQLHTHVQLQVCSHMCARRGMERFARLTQPSLALACVYLCMCVCVCAHACVCVCVCRPAMQPTNALPVGTFIDNMEDQELLDLLPVLQATEYADDVREVLQDYTRTLIARPMI